LTSASSVEPRRRAVDGTDTQKVLRAFCDIQSKPGMTKGCRVVMSTNNQSSIINQKLPKWGGNFTGGCGAVKKFLKAHISG